MFKKVIALSTAAMILLTPMSASAVSWGEVVNGLTTKGSYTDGKMTATKDGDTYTFTGGELEGGINLFLLAGCKWKNLLQRRSDGCSEHLRR